MGDAGEGEGVGLMVKGGEKVGGEWGKNKAPIIKNNPIDCRQNPGENFSRMVIIMTFGIAMDHQRDG